MKSQLIIAGACLTMITTVAFADDTTTILNTGATAGNRTPAQIERRGERIEHRLDRRGDHVENRLDKKGDRVKTRLDAKAAAARAAGNTAKADKLEKRGNAINTRLDR